jgi:16S rRNA (cytidine1402-2'-O)-methyltransferase
LGNRKAVIARELTKLHEEIVRGSLEELAETFSQKAVKGEIVLVIDREQEETKTEASKKSEKTLIERVGELESEGFDNRAALKKAAKEFGLTRSEAYRQLINAK